MGEEALRAFRDRFDIPSATRIGKAPFYRPPDDSPEMQYLRKAQPGVFCRASATRPLAVPSWKPSTSYSRAVANAIFHDHGFCTHAGGLDRDRSSAPRGAIVPDEARTFAWKVCSASSASTRRGTALRAGRCRAAHVVPRAKTDRS